MVNLFLVKIEFKILKFLNQKMTLNLDDNFLTSFSNIIREQNIQLLRTICYDYNWDYDDLYESLFKNDNIFSNLDFDFKPEVKIRNQWIYKNITYYVEEDSNNVYLENIFQGKKFGEELFTECEET